MKEFWNTIQLIFAGVGGWLGWFLGGGILQKAYTLVGDIEKDNRRPQNRAAPDDLHIKDVGNPHQQEDQHLLCDAPES